MQKAITGMEAATNRRAGDDDPARTDAGILGAVAAERSRAILDRAVVAARDLLDMDVAYVSAFHEGDQVVLKVDGDGGGFGIVPGRGFPLEATICRRMVAGLAPNVIRDARNDARVNDLEALTSCAIGAYIGVPVEFSDGTLYGTFCCLSHDPDETLDVQQLRIMQVFSRLIADYLEREQLMAAIENAQTELLARVTHDLRSPLSAILGYASLLVENPSATYAQIIVDETRRLDRMLTELLEEQQAAEASVFDLAAVVEAQVAVFRGQSAAHTITVAPGLGVVSVFGDAPRTESVIANLLSNAIKYSPGGGKIDVTVEARDECARVSVRDFGIGIPQDQARGIFTKFFRVETDATRAIKGTGLGLALARDLARSQGGEVGFSSTEAEGSTFWLDVPLAPTGS